MSMVSCGTTRPAFRLQVQVTTRWNKMRHAPRSELREGVPQGDQDRDHMLTNLMTTLAHQALTVGQRREPEGEGGARQLSRSQSWSSHRQELDRPRRWTRCLGN